MFDTWPRGIGRAVAALAVSLLLLSLAGRVDGQPALEERAEARRLRTEHPDWLLPAWMGDGPATWTIAGAPYSDRVALVAADGRVAPRNHGPAVDIWLYDVDNAQLILPAPDTVRMQLDDGYLPIITNAWDAPGLRVDVTTFTGSLFDDPSRWFEGRGSGSERAVTFSRLTVSSSDTLARNLAAYVAVRPYGIERRIHAISSAACDVVPPMVAANGELILVATRPAEACGAQPASAGDLSVLARSGQIPATRSVIDPAHRASAMLRFSLAVSPNAAASLELRFPGADSEMGRAVTDGSFDDARSRVANAWRAALGRLEFEVSDVRVNNAFRASQAYLLLNRRGERPRSGPLVHDAFWVRDSVYIGEALARVGSLDAHRATLEFLASTQRQDGSFAAIVDSKGPRPVDEWDAQGQAIVALVSHYRFTDDRVWLATMYESIARACAFLDALRGRTLHEGPETRGLLPANLSAEDLGSAAWHHYWDDFWAIAGYREGAFAARALGKHADADAFEARADDLQDTLLRSVRQVQARTGTSVVPNGPQDVLSSAMARGTTPALWPVHAIRGREWQTLLSDSFARYFELWLRPQDGGYLHVEGTLWPYGGLGIAQAMLRLGMREPTQQVLEWTLSHPTLPGASAWGEAVNARNGGLELGDMPHSWAAAEFINLARDLVMTEDDGMLVVNSGIPDTWLEPGKFVTLRNAPTHHGRASVVMQRLSSNGSASPPLVLQLEGSPPNGWRVHIPGQPTSVVIDRAAVAPPPGGQLTLPPGAHHLLVCYAECAPEGNAS